jgi:hypothetical protein
MGNQLNEKEILQQSKTAYAQWKDRWHKHAQVNGDIFKGSKYRVKQLAFSGYGKQLIIVAMGASLEKSIDLIRERQKDANVDIAVVDKGFRPLIQHGIKPKYVFLADAGVSFDQWVGDCIEQTEGVALIANITANTDWTTKWRGPVYFYVNRDNIGTQDVFIPISGCTDMIPASSNVGNSVVVFAVQNMGYDEHLLVGYDFAWNADGNYYAFTDNDKRFWMRGMQGIGIDGKLAYTSENLEFSRKWLTDYCNMMCSQGKRIFNCSGSGTFGFKVHDLKKRLDKFEPRIINEEVEKAKLMAQAEKIKLDGADINEKLYKILSESKVVGMELSYVPMGA